MYSYKFLISCGTCSCISTGSVFDAWQSHPVGQNWPHDQGFDYACMLGCGNPFKSRSGETLLPPPPVSDRMDGPSAVAPPSEMHGDRVYINFETPCNASIRRTAPSEMLPRCKAVLQDAGNMALKWTGVTRMSEGETERMCENGTESEKNNIESERDRYWECENETESVIIKLREWEWDESVRMKLNVW